MSEKTVLRWMFGIAILCWTIWRFDELSTVVKMLVLSSLLLPGLIDLYFWRKRGNRDENP